MNIGFDAKRIFHNKTGLGNYSRDLVCLLSNIHPKSNFFLYNPKDKKIDRLENNKNVIEVLPTSLFWKKISSIWRLGPVVKQLVADRIQVFHGLSGELPKGLAAANIKSVVTIHDLIFMRYPKLYSYIDSKIHYKKFLHAVNKADQIIAISEQTKRDVVSFLNVDPSKIKVIYQGCNQLFKTEQSHVFKEDVRKKFKLPNQFILNVGTIETRKNSMLIVKAIKDIDTVLVVIGGETPYYHEVKEYIDTENMKDKVVFLNDVALEELVAIYQMANVFVYPSIFEGFGIPIIEALYCKTPVITSVGGCFPEAGGPHSIYINPFDEKELQGKIIEVLSNAELRNTMADRGYEFVQKFNDNIIAEEMMNVYKGLIKDEK
jgi:glycosyltransferase involved in cell wall biosynthesis